MIALSTASVPTDMLGSSIARREHSLMNTQSGASWKSMRTAAHVPYLSAAVLRRERAASAEMNTAMFGVLLCVPRINKESKS